MPEAEHYRLAKSSMIASLERLGGTIPADVWSGILMLAESEEDEARFEDVVRAWRRVHGLNPDEDFLVGPTTH